MSNQKEENALYTGVDSIFVSRYVSTDALSAINIVMPVISLLWGLGTMFATGGSAIIARKMGEKKEAQARQNFSAIILVGTALGIAIAIFGTVFLDNIPLALGANAKVLPYGQVYLGVLILFAPAVLIQVLFQSLFVTAGKPHLGLTVMIGAGSVFLHRPSSPPFQMARLLIKAFCDIPFCRIHLYTKMPICDPSANNHHITVLRPQLLHLSDRQRNLLFPGP